MSGTIYVTYTGFAPAELADLLKNALNSLSVEFCEPELMNINSITIGTSIPSMADDLTLTASTVPVDVEGVCHGCSGFTISEVCLQSLTIDKSCCPSGQSKGITGLDVINKVSNLVPSSTGRIIRIMSSAPGSCPAGHYSYVGFNGNIKCLAK